MEWQTSRFRIDLNTPRIMGIVNVTPDSFSDGGRYNTTDGALAHCERLAQDGVDILDIGGESTRPGSPPVGLEEELSRVLPVVREAVKLGLPVSVDTYKAEVMRAVMDLGADIINDVWALRRPGSLQALADHPLCGVCLMHMHRDPLTMQLEPMEGDVLPAILDFLAQRVQVLRDLGVARERIAVDPGIGFGKTPQQNFRLLSKDASWGSLGVPVLAGWSRKSSLGWATGKTAPADRLVASVAAALIAVERGARIVRVHDVKETRQALQVWLAQRG